MWRWTDWMVAAVLVTFAPLASPAVPGGADLVAIVVNGNRLAELTESGLVTVTRDGARQEGHAGMPLQPGDRIDTGDAVAVIRDASGTELLIATNSGGRIGSLTDFSGEMFVKSHDVFEVGSNLVNVQGRGAAYLVRASRRGRMVVTVVEGVVDLRSTRDAWPSRTATVGTTTRADERAATSTRATVEELSGARKWVEQVERLVPPPRQAPAYGTANAAVAMAAVIAAAAATPGPQAGVPRPPQYRGDPPCPTQGLASFPWPHPPQPSVTAIIPPYLLFGAESTAATLAGVSARLESAIERAGYREPKYLGAGCSGFAIVLDLEHINDDGSRMTGSSGFAPPSQEEAFSLASYIKRLFYAPPGQYRQIVFLVSDQRMANATAAPSDAQLRAITRDGVSSLPSVFSSVPFTSRHVVQALIYEFEKGPRDGDAAVIPPQGRLGATVHLKEARLF